MNKDIHIHKAAGILIKARKLLVERSKGKHFFIAPGGSIEAGETPEHALARELKEEFGITVKESDLENFGSFKDKAAGQEDKTVYMEIFLVKKWQGEPSVNSEVEEIVWITSRIPKGLKVGSIFERQVIPRLKELDLID